MTRRAEPGTATRTLGALTTVVVGALLLAGCGSSDSSGDDGGRVRVVASTDVWGDVAQAIGGSDVDVTSFISDPAQDPHSFEASTSTLLAVSKADVAIENGGGYDDFMSRMLKSSGSKASVVDAVTVSGHKAPEGGELNEHVWYDFPTVRKVATTITALLTAADPSHATAFKTRARVFDTEVAALEKEEAVLRRTLNGKGVGITEPVPLYLTDAVGLRNRTPAAFSEAVEEGEDVSPSVLQQTLDLYTGHRVAALVYNEQTSGPVTERVEQAAKSAGIPVVPVTETLPAGEHYVGWMRANLAALRTALAG